MSGFISKLCITSIVFSLLAIFGCSSSDDGGGSSLPSVPAGAVVITDANAQQVVADAISGGTALLSLVPYAVDSDQAPAARDIINLAVDKSKSLRGTSVLSTPTGVQIDEPCSGGGSITGDVTETSTSVSGTITFNACTESGITINGTITINASIDASENWTLSISGNLSGSDGAITTTLSGLSFNETGNDVTAEFSINTYTFAVDLTGGGGFLVQLLAAITGNENETCPASPRSGVVQVTGADSTKAKGTINSNGTVTIEFDNGNGTFTEVPGSPFSCLDFFV